MKLTIPADLLELNTRFETWRTNRKYARQPIPDELWNAAANLSRRYPPSLVGRVLKLDSSRLKKFLLKRSPRTSIRKKPQATFFQLPTEIALPEVGSSLPQSSIGCRLQIERPDGSRLMLTLPSLDLVSLNRVPSACWRIREIPDCAFSPKTLSYFNRRNRNALGRFASW
jgi:hypothetical protein